MSFRDWDEGLLTWCEECGSDEYGPLRVCPDCDDEVCFRCYGEHVRFCVSNDEYNATYVYYPGDDEEWV